MEKACGLKVHWMLLIATSISQAATFLRMEITLSPTKDDLSNSASNSDLTFRSRVNNTLSGSRLLFDAFDISLRVSMVSPSSFTAFNKDSLLTAM